MWHAKRDGTSLTLKGSIDLGDLVLRADQADLQSFDFPEPAFAFGLNNPGLQVIADLLQSWPLRWVRPQ
jgi:hypothetical protein